MGPRRFKNERLGMDIRSTIRDFVTKELNRRPEAMKDWSDGESLFSSKRTDSLFFVDLIVFLENRFSIDLKPSGIRKEDLDSVDKMVAFVESHL